MRHIGVVVSGVPLLMTAFCTDEYLVLEIKGKAGSLNQLEQQFATTEVATRPRRWLDECAHLVLLPPDILRSDGMNQSKRLHLKR